MAVEAVTTSLPTEVSNIIVSPTANRWWNAGKTEAGFLPRLVKSSQEALAREGLCPETLIILGDASDRSVTDRVRAKLLDEVSVSEGKAPVYALTPETRQAVAREIAERTGLRQKIVSAILEEDDYGKQRTNLDTVAGGIALASGQEVKVMTVDDDVIIPKRYAMVKEGVLPVLEGLRRTKNSQVIFEHDGIDFPEEVFERHENAGFKPFLEHLGKTVGEVRKKHPRMRATRTWVDTMHQQLEASIENGSAQFVVTYPEDDDVANANHATIIGASAAKSGMPDYRTVQIAKIFLEDDLPEGELDRQSFPFGPKELFGFRECNTNVDSAAFARLFNEKTIFWPWWFVSDLQISLDNPYGSVPAKYRADNELLPVLLKCILERTGENYLYLAGVSTQVLHKRAKTGYRPDLPTGQAPASLVGNIAALEASRMLVFDPQTGIAHMPMVDGDYRAPEDHSYSVFRELTKLAQISTAKIFELDVRAHSSDKPATTNKLLQTKERYQSIVNSLAKQLAGWDFRDWKKSLDVEIRDQLNFYGQVLEALPSVIEASGQLISEGRYPVIQFVSSAHPSVSYRNTPTKLKR